MFEFILSLIALCLLHFLLEQTGVIQTDTCGHKSISVGPYTVLWGRDVYKDEEPTGDKTGDAGESK